MLELPKATAPAPKDYLAIVVGTVAAAGIAVNLFLIIASDRAAHAPDASGFESFGVFIGIVYLVFLLPTLLLAFTGACSGRPGYSVAALVLLVITLIGAPVLLFPGVAALWP